MEFISFGMNPTIIMVSMRWCAEMQPMQAEKQALKNPMV
jgi:hypothetical protein